MTDAEASPKIGDLVAGPKDRMFTIRAFPDKIGHAPGSVYEGVLTMDEKHEARWVADTLGELVAGYKRTNGEAPDEDALAMLQEQAAASLRPMPTLISRETGEPFQKPREMRITGLVADLKSMAPNIWRLRTQAEFEAELEAHNGE